LYSELVIATAGTDEKVKFVEQHGAKGVNYKTQNFADEVRKQLFPSSHSLSKSQIDKECFFFVSIGSKTH